MVVCVPGLQVHPESESDRRHREEALTSTPRWLTTDLGNGMTPDTGTEASLREFSQFDTSTSGSDSSRESLSAGVGKEGRDLGKLRNKSSRNAPDNDDHFQPAFPIPDLTSRNLAQP